MRYHYEKPHNYIPIYGKVYKCSHPRYLVCTLYLEKDRGIAVVQERFDTEIKHKWYSEVDPWLANDIYLAPGFSTFFKKHAKKEEKGLYPTFTVRQIMWKLRMKPLKKELWECDIR